METDASTYHSGQIAECSELGLELGDTCWRRGLAQHQLQDQEADRASSTHPLRPTRFPSPARHPNRKLHYRSGSSVSDSPAGPGSHGSRGHVALAA